jgi:hypothetical protein
MVTIVTAASSNHFKTVKQFLNCLPKSYNIIFYDIGLSDIEQDSLKNNFPHVQHRVFNFSDYPDFIRLTSKDAGAYAWKPIIINQVYSESDDILIWCDSGNMIKNDIEKMLEVTRTNKVYTPISAGTIAKWTHPTCIKNMNMNPNFIHKKMRNAAIVSFLSKDPFVLNFLNEWKNYALLKDISLPDGADRSNHRHDQSILTILFYKHNIPEVDSVFGFDIHKDID